MKGENDTTASHLTNSPDTVAGFVSSSGVHLAAEVTMTGTGMYAENLDDYGESLNGNAVDITKDRGE